MSAVPDLPASVRVGIDIGGTGTRFAAIDAEGVVVARHTVRTPVAVDAGAATAFLADGIAVVTAGAGGQVGPATISGVGIGASGPVDADGIVRNPHTLPGFSDIALAPLVTAASGAPCVVESDAVAAAVAEATVGAGRGAADLLHVTIGTGIGVAVVRHGSPVLGADGFQPEAGHLDVPDEEPAPCYCGRTRCWEQTASRWALQRLAGVEDVGGLDRLAAAALDGVPTAQAVFDRYGQRVGLGLRTLVTVLRPTRVVIGGGGARFLDAYRDATVRTVRAVALHGLDLDLRATALDDDGGAVGAALLAAI
ncbi:hypothetical protein DEI82_09085 [Curtobacterium sp. MCBD17_019]|nr:hypothetical protein DEI82_09085 [Curtobacterium sp. MCBD17_019]